MSDFTKTLDTEARRYALNMIALWAAGQLGKTGDDANEFAREFLAKNGSDGQHAHLFDRLCQLLLAKGICTKEEILEKMNEYATVSQACFKAD